MIAMNLPPARFKAFDASGNPASLGWVYSYVAGSSTPKSLYQDAAGTPYPNPFQLDVNGEADIYFSGYYKIDVKTSALVSCPGYPIDNVVDALTIVTTGGNLTVTATGGNTAISLPDRFGYQLSVIDNGADNTGATSSSTAINSTITANTVIFFPKGTYLLDTKILMPYGGPNGNRKHLHFDNVELLAGSNNMTMLHCADCFCSISGRVRFHSNGRSGINAISFSPELGASNTTVTNQNYNRLLAHIETIGCDEGIEFMCGVPIGGTSSGCWYNVVYSYFSTSCKRAIWFRDNGSVAAENSGPNSQTIYGMIVNGSCNTGVQVDAGGGHQIHTIGMENIQIGTSPNATPVGIKINEFMANGGRNANIKVFGSHWENVTKYVEANEGTIEFFGVDNEIEASYGALVPLVDYYKSVKVQKGNVVNGVYGIVASIANIRSIWLFDQYGSSDTVVDHGLYGNSLVLRNSNLASQYASQWGPNIFGLAQGLSYADQSHLFNTPNNAYFNFGNGATDSAFTIMMLFNPSLMANTEIFSKDDVTTASPKRCYSFSLNSNGILNANLFDNSTGGYIGRTTAAGVVVANVWQLVTLTYSSSATNAGVKIYVGASQVDNADQSSGVYTAMESLSSTPGSYRISTAGTPERALRSKVAFLGVFSEEFTAAQVRRAYNLLLPYVGAGS